MQNALEELSVELGDTDLWLSRARALTAEAIRLRATASKLEPMPVSAKMIQLAALYEQLSLCYLEESCVVPADRRSDIICESSQATSQSKAIESTHRHRQ